MAYLSKETVLNAYKVLSTLSADPLAQGATQRISAIRYLLALDMFYKTHNRPCDTQDRNDAVEYIENVGKVVAVNETQYTTNFYYPLKNNSDYAVGSNFYSVNVVHESVANGGAKLVFPRRGSTPIMNVQSGKLYEDKNLIPNIKGFIGTDEHKSALVVWLLRNSNLGNSPFYVEAKNALGTLLTQNLINELLPASNVFDPFCQKMNVTLVASIDKLTDADIKVLFKELSDDAEPNEETLQVIYFGTPGCGKSHAVKEFVTSHPGIEIRTTFHPDTDYASFVGAYKPSKDTGGITYKYVPQAFTKAYCKAWKNPDTPVYLIIEEINRGNCAQIFGDLFQLLDRDEGVSEYPVSPDTDLEEYLKTELVRLDSGEVIGTDGIEDNKLTLPANLHILATMNTSDQSLFPMDSAFKRRWNWIYVPIDADNPESQFVITLGDKKYEWGKFLIAANEHIKDVSESEDKQMGNFFIKDDIKTKDFVSKVMFYLWSEVCKDEYRARSFFHYKDGNNDEFSFNQLFKNENRKTVIDVAILHGFMSFLGVPEK
jgi:hypothetical protein